MDPQKVRLFSCALSVVLSAWSVDVHGQQSPDPAEMSEAERAELGTLLSRAKRAYEASNYLEAIEALEAAHEMFPEPNILYRIGDAYEQLGDLEKAVDFYRAYVTAAPQASDRNLVQRRVEDLERRISDVQRKLAARAPRRAALLLDTNPAGATVVVDGESVDDSTPVRVEVEPGPHTLSLTRDGYTPIERTIEVDDGETISLVYQLDAVPVPPQPRGPGAWPWLLGGVGVASLGTGIGLLVAASVADRRVGRWDEERDTAYESGEPVPERPGGYDAAARNRVHFRNAGFVAAGFGGLAILGSVAWLLLGGEETATSAWLVVSPDGLAVGSSW